MNNGKGSTLAFCMWSPRVSINKDPHGELEIMWNF